MDERKVHGPKKEFFAVEDPQKEFVVVESWRDYTHLVRNVPGGMLSLVTANATSPNGAESTSVSQTFVPGVTATVNDDGTVEFVGGNAPAAKRRGRPKKVVTNGEGDSDV